jgi:hypothetical protein
VKEQWVFGGFDTTDKVGFLVAVAKRDKRTLEAAIKKYILPGSTIVADMWRAYGGIVNIVGYNYQHLTVNHSKNFVDPTTGATTNHVEGMWSVFKRRHRTNYGPNRELLNSHLKEFMWRQRFSTRFRNGTRKHAAFHNFIATIRTAIPIKNDE